MMNGLDEGRDAELNRNCLKVERNPANIVKFELLNNKNFATEK